LQELLEPSLVPRCVEELLGRELVASPPSAENILSPPIVEGKVVEVRPVDVVDAYSEPSKVDCLPMPEMVVALTPELQLAIAFEVFHRLRMAAKSRLLSVEELDLFEFLVASLSSSLACKVVESPVPPSVSCEVVILQFDPVVPSASPHVVGMRLLQSSSRQPLPRWLSSCRPLVSRSPSRRSRPALLPWR
jgi:hypothetical protein